MASPSRALPTEIHPLLRGVIDEWQAKAGVWSALPDAPVVPDTPRWRRSWRWVLPGSNGRRHGAADVLPCPNGLSCPIGIGNVPAQTSIKVPGAAH